MPDPQVIPPRRWVWFSRFAKLAWFGALAMWALFVAAWIVLHWVIVPKIDDWRPRIETWASQSLGQAVRIGRMEAKSDIWVPQLTVHNFQVLDAQGKVALNLKEVKIAVSPTSLLRLGVEQMVIEGPELDVRRSADGKLYVAGLDMSGPKTERSDNSALDWLLTQPELVVRNGKLHWTDELRQAPTVALSQVLVVFRHKQSQHSLRIDATPDADWGQAFSVVGQFRRPLLGAAASDVSKWSGQAHADFTEVNVTALRQHLDLGEVQISSGRGAVRAWANVSAGRVGDVTLDMALPEVRTTLGAELAPLEIQNMQGRISLGLFGGASGREMSLSTTGLRFATTDGVTWPATAMEWKQERAGATATLADVQGPGSLRAEQINLTAVNQLAERLPLGTATVALLRSLDVSGQVQQLRANWVLNEAQNAQRVREYTAQAKVQDFRFGAVPATQGPSKDAKGEYVAPAVGRPGVSSLNADIEASDRGGKAAFSVKQGHVDLPGVFESPRIALDQAEGVATWKFDGDKIEATISDLRFANADAAGSAKASWRTSDPANSQSKSQFPGIIDLEGVFTRAVATSAWKYLPQSIPPDARDYVRQSILAGTGKDLKFKIKGDLFNMPFNNPALGDFLIAGPVNDVVFAYVPKGFQTEKELPWPAFTQLSGVLKFERSGMSLSNAQARIDGHPSLVMSRTEATIADLGTEFTVNLTGELRGNTNELVSLVNTSPLRGITSEALMDAKTSGQADMKIKLGLPVFDLQKSRANGTLTLAGTDFQFKPNVPKLEQAKGIVTFNEQGFVLNALTGKALGGEVRVAGGQSRVGTGTATETITSLKLQGTASAEGLRAAKEIGFLQRMAELAAGQTTYSATVGIKRGLPEIVLSTSLQGMSLNLPAPVGKTAEASLPIRYEQSLVKESVGTGHLQDQLLVSLGNIGQVSYVRDLGPPNAPLAQAVVLRGAVAAGLPAGESLSLPDAGVIANINLDRVDVDAWEKVLSGAAGASVTTVAPANPAQARSGADAALSYLPNAMAVRAKELVSGGRSIRNVVLGGSREAYTWRVNLDASELNGYVEFRQPSGNNAGRVWARLARLTIPQSTANEVVNLLEEQPQSVPALDVIVEDFELRGRKFGRVEIEAVNRINLTGRDIQTLAARELLRETARENVREWRLTKLNVVNPEMNLSATGNWAAVAAQAPTANATPATRAARRRTVLNFNMDIADAGGLLNRLGMTGVLRRGKGKLSGQVAWLGSPLNLDYGSLSGQLALNVENGQFLKADPGIGRLLGVLSLQSLPRRLSLDFKDVFTEGFAFDFVRGNASIDKGVIGTNNIQMKGVTAAVLLQGQADLERETQDLYAVVVPEINAGTASLIATVVNPAVGLGTFLAQLLLRKPLSDAATQTFRVDGTWSDPKVTKVPNNSVPISASQAGTNAAPQSAP